jgi:hypothetical protein
MNVSLNESGEDEPAARVDRLIVPAEQIGSDRGDSAVLNRHVALDDVEAIVHRDDQTVTDEQ